MPQADLSGVKSRKRVPVHGYLTFGVPVYRTAFDEGMHERERRAPHPIRSGWPARLSVMRYMIASDIHGSAYYCEKMVEAYRREGADRLILLGDLLYHGPRNDLPRGYAPREVIEMLNAMKSEIFAVRGNCEAEVDQMVLAFPVLADYAVLDTGTRLLYLSHGRVYNEEHLPPLQKGDVFMYGHTHVLRAEKKGDYTFLNPGSVALPKEGNVPTYAILEDGVFSVRDFEGNIIKELEL